MSRTALIVIDVQESFRVRPNWQLVNHPDIVQAGLESEQWPPLKKQISRLQGICRQRIRIHATNPGDGLVGSFEVKLPQGQMAHHFHRAQIAGVGFEGDGKFLNGFLRLVVGHEIFTRRHMRRPG